MNIRDLTYNECVGAFINLKDEYRPVAFLHLDGDISQTDNLCNLIDSYKKDGYGGVALLPVSETSPEYQSEDYFEAYGKILEKLKSSSMNGIYYDDKDFPTGSAGGEFAKTYPESVARHLVRYEGYCQYGEVLKYKLHKDGQLMSFVAYEVDLGKIIDLRDKINPECDEIEIETPSGNWIVEEYRCELDSDGFVNYLSYSDCEKFISMSYANFVRRFGSFIGNTVYLTFYDDIQFRTKNRRMWDEHFNEVFEKLYGYDPAPYYPAMFEFLGKDTSHYRAQLFNCRAYMLINGFFKAVSDYTSANGLDCTGHVSEPKTSAAPWLYGDAMLYQKYAASCGMDLIHRYMYGYNGLKQVSSSAYNFDKQLVCCEIFGNYQRLDKEILYKDAMNAFAGGANYLIPHTLWLSGKPRIPHEVSGRNPEFSDIVKPFNDYVSRAQALLRGGRHCADIAVLYPQYALAAQSRLFDSSASPFEFPDVPSDADYMNVINTLRNYCIRDCTMLHPETMTEKCHADNGVLYLSNEHNYEQYSVLIVPSSRVILLDNLKTIEQFFNGGGKVIFTGSLPSLAFEYSPENNNNNDKEAAEIIGRILGRERKSIDEFTQYYYNGNANGGEVYYLPANGTSADGTDTVDGVMLSEILYTKFGVAYDVIFEDAPRIKNSGLLNLPITIYQNVDEDKLSGGVFNYIHRVMSEMDIIFVSNATGKDYSGRVKIKGDFSRVELWNPYNGCISSLDYESVTEKGCGYISVKIDIANSSSAFVVCRK